MSEFRTKYPALTPSEGYQLAGGELLDGEKANEKLRAEIRKRHEGIILFGAGTAGRVIARDYKERVLCFADNDERKWGASMEGLNVLSPARAAGAYPDAIWTASVIIPELHKEITAEIERMGVKTIPVWGFLPQRIAPPPERAKNTLLRIANHDAETSNFLWDQIHLRNDPEKYIQIAPADIKDIYFPDFITRREDEGYWDCGAADGDTVKEFAKKWTNWNQIYASEPDRQNLLKLRELLGKIKNFYFGNYAVSDHQGVAYFAETGDYSAHLDKKGDYLAPLGRIDDCIDSSGPPPTYIKMDIEGAELTALWGARETLKRHSPVLAICAYHEASHFWEIPLLIHAIQPDYRLYFRRYAQGTFELVWYAVPPDRVKQ